MDKPISDKLEDDKRANAIGETLAVLLNLKKDKEHKDRWSTAWGSKTNAGLARSIYRVFEEA